MSFAWDADQAGLASPIQKMVTEPGETIVGKMDLPINDIRIASGFAKLEAPF